MSQPHNTCDPRRIEGCLADSLGADEMAQFEAHLESCSTCREALESSAAGSADWKSAREFLSSDDAVGAGRVCNWPILNRRKEDGLTVQITMRFCMRRLTAF